MKNHCKNMLSGKSVARRLFPVVMAGLFFLCSAAAFAFQPVSEEEQFLDGLRKRQLFRLAESFCRGRLEEYQLSEQRRALLTAELARTYAEHAVNSPPQMRGPLWQLAGNVYPEYQKQHAQSPFAIYVQLQDALTTLLRGELARQEAQLLLDGQEKLAEARQQLRQASKDLQQTEQRLQDQLRKLQQTRDNSSAPFTAEQLQFLRRNVGYQLARAFRNQALCFSPGSADFVDSLSVALESLGPIAELAVADDLVWRSRLDQVACYRMLGDQKRANALVARWMQAKPPKQYLLRGQAESIRILIAQNQINKALQTASLGRSVAGQTSPLLDYAHLEALVAAWKIASQAKDEQQMEDIQKRSSALIRLIEQDHSAYWVRRAGLLLASGMQGAQSNDLATLERSAKTLYRLGQFEEAVRAYDKASRISLAMKQAEDAFRFAMAAAAIEHLRKAHLQAAQRFRNLAVQFPANPKSSEAHLSAIWHAGEQIRKSPAKDRKHWFDQYEKLLHEHLKVWPQSESSNKVRLYLGNLFGSRKEYERAIDVYRQVPASSAESQSALEAIAINYQSLLETLKSAGQPTGGKLAEVVRLLQERMPTTTAGPNVWDMASRNMALMIARLQLEYGGERRFVETEKLLIRALQESPDAEKVWQEEARILLVYALAGQGKGNSALAVMQKVSQGSVEQLISILEALTLLMDHAPDHVRGQLGRLQLRAIGLLEGRKNTLDEKSMRIYESVEADALAAVGETQKAVARYERLVKKYPQDGKLAESRARLLQASGHRQTLEQAIVKWHAVERKSKRGSDRWFRARYAQAETYYRLGEREKALKMIDLTSVFYPKLGGEELRGKFLRLKEYCEK